MSYSKDGISESDMQAMFRKSELERRETRRKVILNHVELDNEFLSVEDMMAHRKALDEIAKQRNEFERKVGERAAFFDVEAANARIEDSRRKAAEYKAIQMLSTEPGYFRRLWNAIKGVY